MSKLSDLLVKAEDIVEIVYTQAGDKKVPAGLKIGDKVLTTEEILKFKSEAEAILESEVWKLVRNRAQFIGQLNCCEKASTTDDLLWGKSIIYAIQEIQATLNIIKSFTNTGS